MRSKDSFEKKMFRKKDYPKHTKNLTALKLLRKKGLKEVNGPFSGWQICSQVFFNDQSS